MVFETLSVNLLAWNQQDALESSWFAYWKRVSRLLDDFKNPVSSANKQVKNNVQSGRSFMYRRNSRGPKAEPWGTPHKISLQEDSKSLTLMYWVLFVR